MTDARKTGDTATGRRRSSSALYPGAREGRSPFSSFKSDKRRMGGSAAEPIRPETG